MNFQPPKLFLRFFHWYCHPQLVDHIEGDLLEDYAMRLSKSGRRKANIKFIIDVLLLFRPGIIRPVKRFQSTNPGSMISNYITIGTRNLLRSKGYSLINIGGLAAGLAVAMLIGLWIYDELSFNKYHPHYDRIAQVMQNNTMSGGVSTGNAMPLPAATELRNTFGSDFEQVMLSSWIEPHVFASEDIKFRKYGSFMQENAPDVTGLQLFSGSKSGLKEPNSIFISETFATAFFGIESALDKTLTMDGVTPLKVTGVFRNFPRNSSFSDIDYVLPWQLNINLRNWVKYSENKWDNNSFQVFVKIAENSSMAEVSDKIRNLKAASNDSLVMRSKPEVFLQPMSKWHLYSEFENGVHSEGAIQFVWMFGIIGAFVLILACINFMNLSTARSERRAKEVGVRKSLGSGQFQLIAQFLVESIVVAFIGYIISIVLVVLALPSFNAISGKNIMLPWGQPVFWMITLAFMFATGLIAGTYPALYLSAFQPIKVLKGTLAAGSAGSIPRKALVVVQFTISIALILGTAVVFLQINHAKDRPRGYKSDQLVYVSTLTPVIHDHFNAVRSELISAGVIEEMAESESPLTAIWNNSGGYNWPGKDPDFIADFGVIGVSPEFGVTVGWEFVAGRDFIHGSVADSMSIILNESAVRYMGLKDPIGAVVTEPDGKGGIIKYPVVGVIKDMVMGSPYTPVKQSMFYVSRFANNWVNVRLGSEMDTHEAITKLGDVFQKYDPASLFTFRFADDEFALKFQTETRVGKLASFFSSLAVFISCLGLFGLASFTAQQRVKEIGVRKIMGASIGSLWQLLAKDFILLVIISCLIAVPLSWYFMNNWLESYQYRTAIPVWIFVVTIAGAIAVTLLTISVQVLKAARANPVNSLRAD